MLVDIITVNTPIEEHEVMSFPDQMKGSANACVEMCARAYPNWTSMVVVVVQR